MLSIPSRLQNVRRDSTEPLVLTTSEARFLITQGKETAQPHYCVFCRATLSSRSNMVTHAHNACSRNPQRKQSRKIPDLQHTLEQHGTRCDVIYDIVQGLTGALSNSERLPQAQRRPIELCSCTSNSHDQQGSITQVSAQLHHAPSSLPEDQDTSCFLRAEKAALAFAAAHYGVSPLSLDALSNLIKDLSCVGLVPDCWKEGTCSVETVAAEVVSKWGSRVDGVFLSQKLVGEEILQRLQKHLEMGPSSSSAPPRQASRWNRIHVCFALPNTCSLEKQTKQRLEHSGWRKLMSKYSVSIEIVRNAPHERKRWAAYWDYVQKSPRVLFVLIHDEAHWGLMKKSVCDEVLLSKISSFTNAFHVLISATPYPHLHARRAEANMILWDRVIQRNSEYVGREELQHAGKWRHAPLNLCEEDSTSEHSTDDDGEDICDVFAADRLQGREGQAAYERDRAAAILLDEYVDAFHELESLSLESLPTGFPWSGQKPSKKRSEETRLMIRSLLENTRRNHQHSIIVTRHCRISNAQHFAQGLRQTLQILRRKDPLLEIGVWLLGEDVQLGDDFTSRSGFLIVVDRGAMGDTFPSNVIYYDERLKFRITLQNKLRFQQEVGRAFGYGPRPTVLLSTQAWSTEVPDSLETLGTTTPNARLISTVMVGSGGKDFYQPSDKCSLSAYLDPQRSPADEYFGNRWFLLWAKPQCGKTGAVMHFIRRLAETVGTHCEDSRGPH